MFLSDPLATFSKSIGWSNGVQANRYAILLNQGVVVYAARDERGQISVRRRSIHVIFDWFGVKLTHPNAEFCSKDSFGEVVISVV